jgi:hypothetical protein
VARSCGRTCSLQPPPPARLQLRLTPSDCLGIIRMGVSPRRWEIPVLVAFPDVEDVLTKTSSEEAGKQQEQRNKNGTMAAGR